VGNIDWQDPNSKWNAMSSNRQLSPGGAAYERYLWVRDQIPAGARVLDVGCNCGQLAVNLTRDLNCRVVGVDIVPEFIAHCRERKAKWGEFHCGDFSRATNVELDEWGLFENSVDVVTALEVIEHPIDVRGFAYNVRYALKPGGRLIITTPHPQSEVYGYDYLHAHPHHVRMWTRWRLGIVFGPIVAYAELRHGGVMAQIGAVFEG
jgi:2-polyprenyl-3-methyl-5-hydroxy-6-metoxy-1,4-benzoquinol methylase